MTIADWWRSRLPVAALMPVGLFLALRPEPYGIEPNGLDPFFYTGYAINFGDIMREVGDTRYFVTRWTAYMPSRMFSWMFGAYEGRLVLRWLIATSILLAVWHLGRRWRWTRSTEFVVGVTVLTSPMFARAFLTDYVEWVVVAAGIVLICQCLEPRARRLRAAAIGVLAAAIVIANPLAAFVAIAPCCAYLIHLEGSVRERVLHAAIGAVAAVGVVLVGFVAFRVLYDIPNVYAPTIDFLRERTGERDLLKSPRLEWMGAFTWIYAPALLLAAVTVVEPLRRRITGLERGVTVLVLLGIQYAFQWIDQFLRDGNGLEISYYWSFVYPSFAVALALVVGVFNWTWRHAAILVALWWLLLLLAVVDVVRLPSGWLFAVLSVMVIAAIFGLRSRIPAAVALLIVFLLSTQTMSPPYDPTAYHVYNVDPEYDEIFYNPNSMATSMFKEAIWLERELDRLPDDSGLFFFGAGNGPAIIGIYGAHVSGKWLVPDDRGRFPVSQVDAAAAGQLQRLVLLGQDDIVAEAVDQLVSSAGGKVVLRKNDPIVDAYELAVVEMPNPATDGFVWSARLLPGHTGAVERSRRAAVAGRDPAGFLTFGPYVQLSGRTYRAAVTYLSDAPSTEIVGFLDVAQNGASLAATNLPGTSGQKRTAIIEFDATEGWGWEFRTHFDGVADLAVESVAVEPLD
jgi:hypothetical protein